MSFRTLFNPRETGERFALKTINLIGLSETTRERVINESLILARLHHKNIVKLYEIYESESAIYLIMELLSGGELFDRLMAQPGMFNDFLLVCRAQV